jgi:hypothetical protein
LYQLDTSATSGQLVAKIVPDANTPGVGLGSGQCGEGTATFNALSNRKLTFPGAHDEFALLHSYDVAAIPLRANMGQVSCWQTLIAKASIFRSNARDGSIATF